MNQQQSQKSREPRNTTGQETTGQDTMRQDSSRPADSAPRATPDGAEADPAMQGEGNRTAARRYNQETTDFARSGRVDQAARDARPEGAGQARDMERAEAEGKSHSRGEDPLLHQRADGRGEKKG